MFVAEFENWVPFCRTESVVVKLADVHETEEEHVEAPEAMVQSETVNVAVGEVSTVIQLVPFQVVPEAQSTMFNIAESVMEPFAQEKTYDPGEASTGEKLVI